MASHHFWRHTRSTRKTITVNPRCPTSLPSKLQVDGLKTAAAIAEHTNIHTSAARVKVKPHLRSETSEPADHEPHVLAMNSRLFVSRNSSIPELKRLGFTVHLVEWLRRQWNFWIPRRKMYQERRAVASLVVASTLLTCLLAGPASRIIMGHPLNKRSFFDLQCKGVYDKSIFARLDRICEDCYNLFREPQLHSLCRKNCFTTDYFKGCIDVLLLQDEMEHIQSWIKQLHGADADV